jgi:hypothetical protein
LGLLRCLLLLVSLREEDDESLESLLELGSDLRLGFLLVRRLLLRAEDWEEELLVFGSESEGEE